MRHARFDLDAIMVNGIRVPISRGSLVVAEPDGITTPDWEVLCDSTEPLDLERRPYDLELVADDREFRGAALLVRTVNQTAHVFRGGSPLEGVTPEDLGTAAG